VGSGAKSYRLHRTFLRWQFLQATLALGNDGGILSTAAVSIVVVANLLVLFTLEKKGFLRHLKAYTPLFLRYRLMVIVDKATKERLLAAFKGIHSIIFEIPTHGYR
jgi:hypothetical protein